MLDILPLSHGTGSWPCPPQGWHLKIRRIVSHDPLNNPCFFSASTPYCEQVGVKRHCGPMSGEISFWYTRINPIKGNASILKN
jgi:hypothetical protein